ncbi:GNAT family N-acetyltransferase [Fonticella tunisiensis]|uniref:Acetyltransferase (GNAT) family protein n=1 Tax=Fonticella tunisiensis TaxID=1096341 RepID=A0A4V3ETK9_9CLOT|nr:GNAT family N-acetyltransferase [Fonticella tunisiensis]TDT62422.1 acetyltransferase (GNAT) family protein [Fonticella tunisiensis]
MRNGDIMAHIATELDFRRIIKHNPGNVLDRNYIHRVYKSGYMIVSDINLLSFCYPVEYFDGILIRCFSSTIEETIDMVSFITPMLKGRIFLSHITDDFIEPFRHIGFKNHYKVSGFYKMDYNLSLKSYPCEIIDFSMEYLMQLEYMDRSLFSNTWRLSFDDISTLSRDRNIKIRLCLSKESLIGFSILRLNRGFGYGYIIKIAVDGALHRRGIGTVILNDAIQIFKSSSILPIFTDTISEGSAEFFKSNGFREYSKSCLLVKE